MKNEVDSFPLSSDYLTINDNMEVPVNYLFKHQCTVIWNYFVLILCIKVYLHLAKANAKATSLPDGFLGDPNCCSHQAAETVRFRYV